ncbi:MAG: hypothetical protein H7177_14950 [Rhizobacter sp.]|nr:hypothetical protein [Bacteriovorax sp.]
MTISLKKLKVLGLALLFVSNFAQASDLWMHAQSSSRYYLSVERSDAGLLLKQFLQQKGEYQSLVTTFTFKNKASLEKYVSISFPEYTAVQSLPSWPIKKIVENNSDKLFGKEKNQVLWIAKNQWSDEWEQKYGVWLSTITPEFYKKYKIQTDCADALVGLRWIFSRINSLPVANTVADTGELFGQFSMRKEWKKYGTADNWYEDELFLAALDYVMNLTSSRTVMNDGFPVKIDKNGLVAGTYIITQNHGSGHAKIISETHYNEITELPLYTLASTSPRAIRLLTKEAFLDQDWPEKGDKEILAFRWPVINKNGEWILQPKEARPAYSLEQFDTTIKADFPAFIEFVLSRVKGNYDPLKLVQLGVQDILNYTAQRIDVVSEGYASCKKINCATGTQGDDEWGTPSRDAKLLKKFHDIDTLVKQFENLSPGLYDRWIAGLRNATIEVEGVKLKLSSLRFIMENNLFSSLGSDSPARRWGLNSNELLTNWVGSVEKLLNDREAIIGRPENPCSTDCHPKTNMWVGLSTYPMDAALNNLFTQINTYCTLIDIKGCETFFATKGQKQLVFNGDSRSIEAWFKIIPYFNSDARAPIARRWGKIPSDIKARILPYFDSVKISKNALALLDDSKLMDMNSGKILFESTADSRIVLTKSGVVYKVDDVKGNIKRMLVDGDTFSWITIIDDDMLLNLQKERPLYIEEDQGYTIFRKPLASSLITFRIIEDKIQFIKENTGATYQSGPLVTLAMDKNTMSFVDLDRTVDVSMTIPTSEDFKDMNQVQISSYKYPNAILSYTDRNQDLYYGILVNLEKKTWTKIAPNFDEKYLVLWSDAASKKAILQMKYNLEFPEVYAISWNEQSEIKVQKLSNLLLGTKTYADTVYFISGTGGVWDQNPKTKLYAWDRSLLELGIPKNSSVKFLTSDGAYFSSEDTGILRTFRDAKELILPKDLLPEGEFCQIQTKSEEILSYRFSTSYGDYSCMGGSLLKSQISISNSELIPQFSQYSWINKESLLDLRWRKSFSDFEVLNGILIGIGKNIGFWWARTN